MRPAELIHRLSERAYLCAQFQTQVSKELLNPRSRKRRFRLPIMKTKMTMLLAMICTLSLSAQDNNRLNDIGKQFLPGLDIIKTDVEKGKVTEINQETVAHYKSVIPMQAEMNLDLASRLVKVRKAGNIKFDEFLANSKGVSLQAKRLLTKIAAPSAAIDQGNLLDYYREMVKEVEGSSVAASEKDMLLALNSIAFNVTKDGVNFNGAKDIRKMNGATDDCFVTSPDGSGYLSPTACVILAASVGFVAGFQQCGLWCGVGAAVFMGVITAITVC